MLWSAVRLFQYVASANGNIVENLWKIVDTREAIADEQNAQRIRTKRMIWV